MSLTIVVPLHAAQDPWPELQAHPELIWGHRAPELEAGREYNATTHDGTGGSGRILTVGPGRIRFTWGQPSWAEPGRFEVSITEAGLGVAASGIPHEARPAVAEHWERTAAAVAAYLSSDNPPLAAPVGAVLFDADGVLQSPREDWLDEFARLGGPAFVADALAAELQSLAGAGDLHVELARLLEGSSAGFDEVLEVWYDIIVDPDALALVDRIRASGLPVGLATNQQRYRGTYMRDVLQLDDHFDHVFYSYEVGHAKPSPAYFEHVVAELGLPPDEVAFVDDAPANITAARGVGLRAMLHRTRNGVEALADGLAAIGVPR